MGNEEFLILLYVIVAAVCLCLGWAAWAWLRTPVVKIVERVPGNSWGTILKRAYPAGILLSALSGFLSVRYYGCGETYEKMISSRAQIVAVSGKQISASLDSVILAVFLGAIVILMSLLAMRRSSQKT
jgi:hypothetical protein